MEILVLNGSPKGSRSVTMQTVYYWEILFPAHHFTMLHVGQTIKKLEKDMAPALEALEKADLILFAYPVYTFITPCQLQRFIELVKASGIDLSGKFAAQLSTSKHFYDITAHRYIQDNCGDLGLKYIAGLSADMDDLATEKGQHQAEAFFKHLLWSMEHDIFEPAAAPLPAPDPKPVTIPACHAEKIGDVVIIADLMEGDTQLAAMIDRFRAQCTRKTRVVNIREYPFRGGCLGCFHCAVSGKCVSTDGFDDYLRNQIQTADAMVYAFTIRDHSMGARFKMYDDRQFCNGHRTVTIGMPLGYLISGNYSLETNLQTILQARAEVGSNYLAGVACDEADPDGSIDRLCAKLDYALEHKYLMPQNFYGIGGMKVFRDLIWLMQGMMRADHKFYKAHKQYDFPQKQWPKMLAIYAVGAMLGNKKLAAKMPANAMSDGMLMPCAKVLAKAREKMGQK